MEASECFSTRLEALEARLAEARRALAAAALDRRLARKVRERLLDELTNAQSGIRATRGQYTAAGTTMSGWSTAAKLEKGATELLGETLAVLQGANARAANVDGGMCLLADTLIDELEALCEAGWNRFTILDTADSYSDTVQLIRLRFPVGGIWDLPVAVHEFGHFVAYRLTTPAPAGEVRVLGFPDYLAERCEGQENAARMRTDLFELFADCFATFVLGPSYPLSTVLLRLQPAGAMFDDRDHPSAARRFAAMAVILLRLDEQPDQRNELQPIRELLDRIWSAALGDDMPAAQAQSQQSGARRDALDFHGILAAALHNARFRGLNGARRLTAAIEGRCDGMPPGASLRDLLNAAWLVRLKAKMSPEAISQRVVALGIAHADGTQ